MSAVDYSNKIIEIIRHAKSMPNWSASDYCIPISRFYSTLSKNEQAQCSKAILRLLDGRSYLECVVRISGDLRLSAACPKLIRLFLNPPSRLKEDGHPIWREGLRRDAAAILGELRCRMAKPVFSQMISRRISSRKNTLRGASLQTYGIVIQALTKIAPKDTAVYFGWWLEQDRKLTQHTLARTQMADDWSKLNKSGVSLEFNGLRPYSMVTQKCILLVSETGMGSLMSWLRSITLITPPSRVFLQSQLEHMLSGNHPLLDLRSTLKFKGNADALAKELSALPLIAQK